MFLCVCFLFGLIYVVDIFVGGDYYIYGNMYLFCILFIIYSLIYVSLVKVFNNLIIYGGCINIIIWMIILIKNCYLFLDF